MVMKKEAGQEKNNSGVALLLVGESQMGMHYYKRHTMDGVAVLARERGIAAAVVAGPFAHVPIKYGKKNAELWRALEPEIDSVDAVKTLATGELETLTSELSKKNVPVHVVWTEADDANWRTKTEDKIAEEWGNKILANRLLKKIEVKEKQLDALNGQYSLAQENLAQALKTVKKLNGLDTEGTDILNSFQYSKLPELSQKEREGIANKILEKIEDVSEERAAEVKKLFGETEHLMDSIRGTEGRIAEMRKEHHQYQVTKFTKQFGLTRTEFTTAQDYFDENGSGIADRALMEYNELVRKALPLQTLEIHPEAEVDADIGGVKVNLAHNRNPRSDAPRESAVRARVKEGFLRNRRGQQPADVDIELHGNIGGLKVYPQEKKRITGQVRPREIPDATFYVQVPTLLSPELVEEAKKNKVSNWDTRRITEPYAAGVTFYKVRDDGVHEVEFYSVKELHKLRETEEKISEMSMKLRGTSKEGRKSVRSEIKELRNSARNRQDVKIVVFSDTHIGAPNEPGSVTNYEYIDAAIKRESTQARPADIIVMAGDMIHGDYFEGNTNEYLGLTDFGVKAKEREIENSILSPDEKFSELKKLNDTARRAIPITDVSLQKNEFQKRFVPYVESVFEKNPNAKLILVDGNHYNKGARNKEHEGNELKGLFNPAYHDRISVFSGTHTGSGQAVVNGVSIYAMHAPKRSHEEVTGLEKHISTSNVDCDVAIGGDHHHCGIGWVDGTLCIAAPGMQPHTKFVDSIAKSPGLRGYMTAYVRPGEEWFKAEFDIDKSLAPYMENVKISV